MYSAPSANTPESKRACPPQIIIEFPVHTAVWPVLGIRGAGGSSSHRLVDGSYEAPSPSVTKPFPDLVIPPQTIKLDPVQTAERPNLGFRGLTDVSCQ